MAETFVIMQIGNPELDAVYREVIVPAVSASGLITRRVDKHNEGGLLKNEIVSFIERAQIIVADLTNERPNCYLEVGYAMGLGKFRNLILTARHDHQPDGPHHLPSGPKVHFDLGGYDVLFWDPSDLNRFRQDLEIRIRRRLAIVGPGDALSPTWDDAWVSDLRRRALAGLSKHAVAE